MFDYITGKKIKASAGTMVVENNGIGYSICVSDECIRFFENAEVVRVYTYLSVREDGISLFGFYGEEERAMFEKLVSISGIGPKVAVAILSGISVDKLAGNIISADTKALNKIKGVGKKTAERIVLELKDKFGKDSDGQIDASNAVTADSKNSSNASDAIAALVSLGFSRSEASIAVSKFDPNTSADELIKNALKYL